MGRITSNDILDGVFREINKDSIDTNELMIKGTINEVNKLIGISSKESTIDIHPELSDEDKENYKAVKIPHKYKYIIDRIYFEYTRSVENLSFMLGKNLNNLEFLESSVYVRLEKEVEEAMINFKVISEQIMRQLNIKTRFNDCRLILNETESDYILYC